MKNGLRRILTTLRVWLLYWLSWHARITWKLKKVKNRILPYMSTTVTILKWPIIVKLKG